MASSNLILICFVFLLCTLIPFSCGFSLFRFVDILERLKRDDGAFLSGSGGPIASNGKGEIKETLAVGKTMGPASGGKCQWELRNKQVINDIADADEPNDQVFKFLGRISCSSFAECELQCRRLSCNYFIKSSVNDVTLMYSVVDSKLAENDWTGSKTYDSFFIRCPRG